MSISITHIRVAAHLFFWLGYFVIVSYTFSTVFDLKQVLLRTAVIGTFHVLMVYTHLLVLIPKLLKRGKYLAYLGVLLLLLWATVTLKIWVILETFGAFFNEHPAYDMPVVLNNIIGALTLLAITTGFWYAEQGILNLRAKEQLARERLESEVQLLRQQMNPHFLFNTLNNIYSLAYTQSEKAPEAILKLSSMLRYMLYECQEEYGPVTNEVEYLQNYIDLQQLKTGHTKSIRFKAEVYDEKGRVPPLLLVPFFENAFKHGNTNPRIGGYFSAHLIVNESQLTFTCENPIKLTSIGPSEIGGIGLSNVKRRLELLYHGKHTLICGKKNAIFKATLEMDLE